MKNLSLAGKYMFAIPMILFGVFHFGGAEGMKGMVPIPGGVIWVYVTGVALVAAGVAIIIGKKARLAAQLLGLMLLIFALSIHLPGAIGGNDMSMAAFLKDLALAGGAWFMSGHFHD